MDPFLGEIRIFGGTFAPKDWAVCNGQILSIAQNTALFSLLGVTYGGNGTTTFGLPDMQGRLPMHAGQGPGLSYRTIGEMGGSPTVTLRMEEMAAHNHAPQCKNDGSNATYPANNVWGKMGTPRQPVNHYASTPGTSPAMNGAVFAFAGGNQPHNNLSPYQAVTFIIALKGIFPPRP